MKKNKGWIIFGIILALVLVIGIIYVFASDKPPVNTGKPGEGNSTKPKPKSNPTGPAKNPTTQPVIDPNNPLGLKDGDVITPAKDGVVMYDMSMAPIRTVNKGYIIGTAYSVDPKTLRTNYHRSGNENGFVYLSDVKIYNG